MLLSRILVAIALVSAMGCDSSAPDTARSQPEADLQLELGETGQADGLTITFEAITGDSRCPEDVECIWAGEAGVRLVIDGTEEELLASDPELAPEAVVRRGNVALRAVGLTPYPGSREAKRGDPPVVYVTTEVLTD